MGRGSSRQLGLEVVPELGQLLVGTQLGGNQREDLLVSHPEDVVDTAAVLETKQLVAHDFPPTGALPHLGGVEHRHQELLTPDGVDLFLDDPTDLRMHAKPGRKQRIRTRHQLANEPAAHQQLVRDRLRPGRVVPQGGNEHL